MQQRNNTFSHGNPQHSRGNNNGEKKRKSSFWVGKMKCNKAIYYFTYLAGF